MRRAEYSEKGDYHKNIDKNWPYYPVYVEKMRFIDKFIKNVPKGRKIIDIGCGEGVLVEKLSTKGYDIKGLDLNYKSKLVKNGSLLDIPFEDNSFDLVLLLDVLEHIDLQNQHKAMSEIKRILKPHGKVLVSVPNLAHLASRLQMLFIGRPIRTALEMERHNGDRAAKEYEKLFAQEGFEVLMKKGLFPTFPLISILTRYKPSWTLWMHRIYNRVFAWSNWCFLNIFYLKKL